ncbi:MAG: hypothetical protein IBGAMO2_560037 [Arenicellales bacterium IbO2]|nr:MAG: hypothetical protein IBGAMO2_560037 [Arenicellales bacterium IbO2]
MVFAGMGREGNHSKKAAPAAARPRHNFRAPRYTLRPPSAARLIPDTPEKWKHKAQFHTPAR